MITLHIDQTPPTVNSMYQNVYRKGRVKTKRYVAWAAAARKQLASQRPKRIETKKYGLVIYINPRANADLSNYIKPLEDLLVSMGITPDDKHNILPVVMRHEGKGVILCVLDGVEAKAIATSITDNLP